MTCRPLSWTIFVYFFYVICDWYYTVLAWRSYIPCRSRTHFFPSIVSFIFAWGFRSLMVYKLKRMQAVLSVIAISLGVTKATHAWWSSCRLTVLLYLPSPVKSLYIPHQDHKTQRRLYLFFLGRSTSSKFQTICKIGVRVYLTPLLCVTQCVWIIMGTFSSTVFLGTYHQSIYSIVARWWAKIWSLRVGFFRCPMWL